MSLATNSILEQLKNANVKYTNLSSNVKIQTLTNSSISFKQCIKLSFKLENTFVTGTFYITNEDFGRDYNVLLGFDFLKNNKILLDCDTQIMKLKNKNIKLHFIEPDSCDIVNAINVTNTFSQDVQDVNENNIKNTKRKFSKNISTAKLTESHIIQGNETKIVELQCPQNFSVGDDILLEPLPHKLNIQYDPSIHTVFQDKKIHIFIANNTDKKLYLLKGMNIGKITKHFNVTTKVQEENIEGGEVLRVNSLSLEEVRQRRKEELKPEDFNLGHLDNETRNIFQELLLKNAHAFSKNYMTLGQSSLVVPRFNLLHNYPIQVKPYKTAYNVKDFAKSEINKLLKANIIRKSDSPYSFPVVFVQKKSSEKTNDPTKIKYRMAVDFRLLNEILEHYNYPLPDVKEILKSIGGKKYFTVLDLHSAFFQINVKEEDSDKLTFITEFGRFSFKRLAFGTCVSSQAFAELIDKLLGHFDKNHVAYFLDDVLIATDTIEHMIDLLDQILKIFIDNNLTIEPSKLQICMQNIEFLGFNINKEGYSPSKRNLHKIKELTRPKNKRGVKSLLGLANYFRALIKDYAEIVDPLVNLTKEKAKFKWSEVEEKAFKAIQAAILENPTLKPPDFSKKFFLITDASKIAVSGILSQEHDGILQPIEFFGRKLKDTEKHYPSYKLELLAIYQAVMHFKYILTGREFIIKTDSKALTYFLNLEKQPDIVARWLDKLAPFKFKVEHIKGENNPCDFVSRNIMNITTDTALHNSLFEVNPALSDENVKSLQAQDDKLNKIITKIQNNKQNRNTKKFALNEKGILILKPGTDKNEYLIAPESLKETIIQESHKPHFGFKKTYDLIKSRFFWYGVYRDVKDYCTKCIACNTTKQHPTIKVPLQKIIKNAAPGEALHIDLIGLLPETFRKNKYIFMIVDSTSRFLEAVPIRKCETQALLTVLNKYFSTHGLPKSITMDNMKGFRAEIFKDYLKALNIEPHFISVHSPRANGLCEVSNKILKNSITAMSAHTLEWDIRLDYFKLLYNTTRHRSLGYSPAELFYGREIRNPFSVHLPSQDFDQNYIKSRLKHIEEIKKQALLNQEKIFKEYLNDEEIQKVKYLNVGQVCYVKPAQKPLALRPKWLGPFEVVRRLRNNNYLLREVANPEAPLISRHISKLMSPTKVNHELVEENISSTAEQFGN